MVDNSFLPLVSSLGVLEQMAMWRLLLSKARRVHIFPCVHHVSIFVRSAITQMQSLSIGVLYCGKRRKGKIRLMENIVGNLA